MNRKDMPLEVYFEGKLYCPEMYDSLNTDNYGFYSACCIAKSSDVSSYDTSFKDWLESDHMKKMRAGDEETINYYCEACITEEASDRGVESRRQRQFNEMAHHLKDDFNVDNNNDVAELKEILLDHLDLMLRFDDDMCDLACFMCGPQNSKERVLDMEKIPLFQKYFTMGGDEHQTTQKIEMATYTNEIIERIDRIIITGGEPTLMKPVKEYLEAIKHNAKHIRLDIQTNMASPASLEKFFPYFRKVKLFISVDGIGKYNEYLRKKSNWDRLTRKIKKYNNMKGVYLAIVPTISMFNYNQVDEITKFWAEFDGGIELHMHNYLVGPSFLSYVNLPDELNHGPKETKFNKKNFMAAVEYMLELDKLYNHDFKTMYPDFWEFYVKLTKD